jgi:hypothetical protein
VSRRLVQQVTGVVAADAADVWDALLAIVRPASAILEVDPDRRVLSISGQWWFHSEYAVTPDPDPDRGSLITYSVFNVAHPLTRWLVPLVAGQALHASPRPMIERQVAAIAARLGVPGHLTDP